MTSDPNPPAQPSRKQMLVVSGLFILLVLFNLGLALRMGSESRANQQLESEKQQEVDSILKEAQQTRDEAGKLLDQAEKIASELAPKKAEPESEPEPEQKPAAEDQPAANP